MVASPAGPSRLRVLVTVQPSWSHLTTVLPIATALRDRGHEVRVASTPSMQPALIGRGLSAISAGVDWDAARAEEFFPGFLRARASSQARHLVSLAGRGTVADLLAVTDEWRPDVILRDVTEFGGMVVAALRDLPVVVVGIGLRPPLDWLEQTFAAPLARLRSDCGLSPRMERADLTGELWISSFPRSFGIPDLEQIAEHHVRPVIADRVEGIERPEWLADVRDGVYVTLGTVFNQNVELLSRLVRVLAGTGIDVIATTGRNVDPAELGRFPSNVRVARYISQSEVAPHVRAIVCHGGYNSVMSALSTGLPVCCVPLAFDHPRNASRCVELGVGTALTTTTPLAGFPWAQAELVTDDAVRQAVLPVLEEGSFRAAAAVLRDEIASMPGPESAMGRVEALAHAR